MNSKEFVQKISDLAPNWEMLVQIGYSEMTAKYLSKSFEIKPKSIQSKYRGELFSLINNFDMTEFNVMDLYFFEKFFVKDNLLVFGKYDLFELGLIRSNYEIALSDPAQKDLIVMKCAATGDSFLSSLFLLTQFSSKLILKEISPDESVNLDMATTLGTTAGGDQYIPFYKYILGI